MSCGFMLDWWIVCVNREGVVVIVYKYWFIVYVSFLFCEEFFGNRCKYFFRIKFFVFLFRIFFVDLFLKNSFEFIYNYGVVRWVIYIIFELWLCIFKVSYLIIEFDILFWFLNKLF